MSLLLLLLVEEMKVRERRIGEGAREALVFRASLLCVLFCKQAFFFLLLILEKAGKERESLFR